VNWHDGLKLFYLKNPETSLPIDKPQMMLLFSDTGGDQRAGCMAIINAFHCEFGEEATLPVPMIHG